MTLWFLLSGHCGLAIHFSGRSSYYLLLFPLPPPPPPPMSPAWEVVIASCLPPRIRLGPGCLRTKRFMTWLNAMFHVRELCLFHNYIMNGLSCFTRLASNPSLDQFRDQDLSYQIEVTDLQNPRLHGAARPELDRSICLELMLYRCP